MQDVLPILLALLAKHFVCDFILQTPYQWKNKGQYGHPGGLLHVAIHAIGTVLALLSFTSSLSACELAALDAAIHYHIDWAKNNINARFDLKPTGGAGFWITFGLDQWLHQLTYVLMIWLLPVV